MSFETQTVEMYKAGRRAGVLIVGKQLQELKFGANTVGRDACDVVIAYPTISREHLTIRYDNTTE